MHHRRQHQAHCLRVPGIPRPLRARGKAWLCRRHRPHRGAAGGREVGHLGSVSSHAESLRIFERRAPQIPEKQAMRCGGAPVPAHSRHHQRLRGVGFKWNWRRCCIWFALLQIAINARDVSACASVFSVRSAHQPFPHGVGFLLEPTPASSLPAVPRAPVVPWCSPRAV